MMSFFKSRKISGTAAIVIFILVTSILYAQDTPQKTQPPKNLEAHDSPNDAGGAIFLMWDVDNVTVEFNQKTKPFKENIKTLNTKIKNLEKEKNKLLLVKNDKLIDLLRLENQKYSLEKEKNEIYKTVEDRINALEQTVSITPIYLAETVKELKKLEKKIVAFNVVNKKYDEFMSDKKIRSDLQEVLNDKKYKDLQEQIVVIQDKIKYEQKKINELAKEHPPTSYTVYISEDGKDFKEITTFDSRSSYASDVRLPFWAWNKTDKKHFIEITIDEYCARYVKIKADGIEKTLHEFDEEEVSLANQLLATQFLIDTLEKFRTRPEEIVDVKADELQGLKNKLLSVISKFVENNSELIDNVLNQKRNEEKEIKERIEMYMGDEEEEKKENGKSMKKKFKEEFDKKLEEMKKKEYHFKISAQVREGEKVESKVVSAKSHGNFFKSSKLNNFIFMVVFSIVVISFIALAKRKQLFLRKIAGLDALDEAVGRATEMGKPVYFMTGRDDISSISTIAATTILGEVAKKVCEYGTTLKVPHTYPITMAVSQEITREAFIRAGKPDAYKPDINFFVTEDQFGYTAAVDGMFVREKPGAIVYMGYYYAESLLLAETGASIGAIQIAGTDADHQLPFFFAACDYTLIGEELYVASAYLSRDPILLGTIRGQDVGKTFLIIIIFLGFVLATVGVISHSTEITNRILEIFRSF